MQKCELLTNTIPSALIKMGDLWYDGSIDGYRDVFSAAQMYKRAALRNEPQVNECFFFYFRYVRVKKKVAEKMKTNKKTTAITQVIKPMKIVKITIAIFKVTVILTQNVQKPVG